MTDRVQPSLDALQAAAHELVVALDAVASQHPDGARLAPEAWARVRQGFGELLAALESPHRLGNLVLLALRLGPGWTATPHAGSREVILKGHDVTLVVMSDVLLPEPELADALRDALLEAVANGITGELEWRSRRGLGPAGTCLVEVRRRAYWLDDWSRPGLPLPEPPPSSVLPLALRRLHARLGALPGVREVELDQNPEGVDVGLHVEHATDLMALSQAVVDVLESEGHPTHVSSPDPHALVWDTLRGGVGYSFWFLRPRREIVQNAHGDLVEVTEEDGRVSFSWGSRDGD